MATHSTTLAWKISWAEEPGGLQSLGSRRVGHDWVTSLSLFTFMHWRRNGSPLQCSCLENPRNWGAWWAAVYGVARSRTRLKWHSSSQWDLTEAEDIKKRCQEYAEELYKKWSSWLRKSRWCDHQPRAGYPGIWSQMGLRKHHYKARGGDGFPVEIFQIIKDDIVKVLHSICHMIGKGQFSFQSLRKTMPKKAQTTAQLHSSHMLVK